MRIPHLSAILIFMILSIGPAVSQPIAVSKPYPGYFEYQGEPVLLLGGSKDDNLFQVSGVEEHLDLLVASGGNYVRNTMSSRDEGNLWAFHKQSDGLYDLNRFNDAYWERFENFLRACGERDIIVQIEIWATFDFYREFWDINPYNPKNNRNYDTAYTKLKTRVPSHPIFRDNPFFWSVPRQNNNSGLLLYQQRFVDKLLSYSLRHDNILYCMDNETNVTSDWGKFWAEYIRKKALLEDKDVLCTEMWNAWDLSHPQHLETMDHPETYGFIDISQNNHNSGVNHWKNGITQMKRLEKLGYLRPLTNVKVYGNDGGRHKTTRQATEAFIRNVMMGCASTRFHRPSSGQGLNERARAVIRSMRELSEKVNVFDAGPENELILGSENAEVYCMASPGKEYVVYFPMGGTAYLNIYDILGGGSIEWLDVLNSEWSGKKKFREGNSLNISSPTEGHWIVVIKSD